MLYTSQVLEVVKNTESDLYLLVSSNLMSTLSPNVGHLENNNIQIINYHYSAKHFNENHRVATF